MHIYIYIYIYIYITNAPTCLSCFSDFDQMEIFRKILVNTLNIKSHENLFGGSGDILCGWTYRHLIVFAVAAWKPLEGHVKVMTVVGNPVGIPTRYFTRTSLKKITVCCDVTSCSLLEIVERFGGNCCPCVQDGYHENGGSRFPRKFARFYCSRRVHIPEELIFIVMAMETSNLTILKHNRFDTAFGIWKNT